MNKIHNVFYMKDRYKRFIFGDYIILPIISSSIDILFLNKTFKLFKRFGDCILLVIVSSSNVKLCFNINCITIIVKTYRKYTNYRLLYGIFHITCHILYIIYLSITFENLILCNTCLSPLRSWRGVLDTTLSDKVSQ
jgi:hypothetical protein